MGSEDPGAGRNVGTQHLATRAQTIATAVGATANAAQRVTALDAGVRVRWPPSSRLQPYLAVGAGVARVRTETAFSVNGTSVAADARGIQLGSDLSGTVTKPVVVVGVGVTWTPRSRAFGDVSVRSSRILPRTSRIPHDQGIDTVRLQAGVGIRF